MDVLGHKGTSEKEGRNQSVKEILPVHVFPFPVKPFLQVQV